MRAATALVMLVLLGCGPRAADLGPELHVLGTLEDVGAAAYSYTGERHPFHELAHAILYEGTVADFERLTKDPRPVSRCMGLYLLARSGSPRAEAILERRMSDPPLVVVYIGCVGNETTVGGFARRLLRDRDYLEFVSDKSPMWSPYKLLADDVRLLAYDGAPLAAATAALLEDNPYDRPIEDADLLPPGGEDRMELEPAKSIRAQLDAGAIALDRETFDRLCRGLPRWRVVKGIGRAGPHPAVRRFLLDRLNDDREDDHVRLVAASALTRDPSPEAYAALKQFAESVGRWAGDPAVGDDLVRQHERRAELEALLREHAAHRSWAAATDASDEEVETAPAEGRAFKAITASGEAVVLDLRPRVRPALLDERGGLFGVREDGGDHLFDWALRASATLRRHRAPWDTYSDAVQALAAEGLFYSRSLFSDSDEDEEEQDPREAELTQNVREGLRALDREPR